ncbi:MAG: hypothetical protein RLZZ630_724 [Bacteroidota bacterium]|jgi:hypothetical protein
MKKLFFTLTGILGFVVTLFQFNSTTGSTSGAPAGYANDPASGQNNCTSCHIGTAVVATPNTASITTNIPSGGYIPGQTYTITATVIYSGRSKFGFEIAAQSSNGATRGTIIVTNTAQTKLVNNNYITHTSGGTSGSGSKTWTFNWVAPAAGSGTVGFYGAFNASNGNGSTLGDIIYITSTSVQENACFISPSITSSADTICPLDQATLTAGGGLTYLWSNGAIGGAISVGPGTYSVIATDANGCTGTATKSIVAKTVAKPTAIITSSIQPTSVKIKWTKADCADGYKIRIRPSGTSLWRNISVGDTSEKIIYNLFPTTTYEYQLASAYGTNVTAYTVSRTFTTTCACTPPSVTAGTITSSTAQFNWNDDACGVQYKIQYRRQGFNTWTSITVGDTVSTLTITGLLTNQAYEFRSRRECNTSGTINSGWSAISTFNTLPLRLGEQPEAEVVDLLRAVDVLGREVDPESKGLIILQYSDGTAKRVFRKE